MLLNRTFVVMLLNCTGGVVWALKPPLDTPYTPLKSPVGSCTYNYLCTYGLYVPVRNDF
jgi:hypothetical protein